MPELPEVETLRIGLQKYIVGKTIVDMNILDRKLFEGDEKQALRTTITNVRRFAKAIVIDLSNGFSFAIHIKLTGQLIFRDQKTHDLPVARPSPSRVPNKFTRVAIALSEDSFLYFQEVRGFAWMKLLPTVDIPNLAFIKSLGPEPAIGQVSQTPHLTLEKFSKIVSGSNLPIKVLLMEQKKIGGVGNIYANDACFDAQIDPRRRAKTLSEDETERLFYSLLKVLKAGLKYKGSSELNFVDVLGEQGEYQKHMLVYGRRGKACIRNDEGIIEKIYLGGRGTFFCEKCQK